MHNWILNNEGDENNEENEENEENEGNKENKENTLMRIFILKKTGQPNGINLKMKMFKKN